MNFWEESENESSFSEDEIIKRFKLYKNDKQHDKQMNEEKDAELTVIDKNENINKKENVISELILNSDHIEDYNYTCDKKNISEHILPLNQNDTYGISSNFNQGSEFIDPHNLIKPHKKKIFIDKNKLRDGLTQEEISIRAMQRIKEYEQKEKEVKENMLKLINKGGKSN